jgi:ribosomal protein S17E
MDPAVVVALVAAVASLAVAVTNGVMARRRETRERQAEAEEVLERYRGPLLAAAFDLQNRLDNILSPTRNFLAGYGTRRNPRRDDAVKTSLYRVAQYFCWVEIIRRDRLFLTLREPENTRAVNDLLLRAGATFADDRHGQDFMLWHEEQRAIGERMINEDGETANCVGYATFVERYPRHYARWFERFEKALDHETATKSKRLTELRRILRELVVALDPDQLRYERSWEQPSEAEPSR